MKVVSTPRVREIAERIAALRSRSRIRVRFAPSTETDFIGYFPQDLDSTLDLGDSRFEIVPRALDVPTDVLIVTAHGANLSYALWELRDRPLDYLVAVWHWDNHGAQINNLHTALAADIVFPSHLHCAAYLANPMSILGPHVPACSAQWTRPDAVRFFAMRPKVRSDKLQVHFVDYQFSGRSALLHALSAEMKDADVRIMERSDRSRYFSKNRADRFAEWLGYKVSLVLPVNRDLSTRVFDGLLAGQTLLVPRDIPDFDEVIPPPLQQELGIVRFETAEVPAIAAAHREALAIFDRQGEAGMERRHRYVLENHMLANRIRTIAETLHRMASGDIAVRFVNPEAPPRLPGLHLLGQGK